MSSVLTIAGFDPSSGAGVTADLMVFAAHRLFGTACITSLTVQSTLGVAASHPVAAETIRATLDHLVADLPPSGIKLGMLADASAVAAVADFLLDLQSQHPNIPIILDPVLRSSSGRELLDPDGLALLRSRLLPLVTCITPNLDELAALTCLPVTVRADMSHAAQRLQATCPNLTILVTGGHLDPPDDLLLTPDGQPHWLPGQHIASRSTHGTGCALSSALLSRLVLGDSPLAAAQAAKHYVAEAIRSAVSIGQGKGPLNHLWPLQ